MGLRLKPLWGTRAGPVAQGHSRRGCVAFPPRNADLSYVPPFTPLRITRFRLAMSARLLRRCALFLLVAALVRPAAAQDDPTRLLRQPTVSQSDIVFVHAGELWRVGHTGGDAERLTSFRGVASHPRLSPDGERIAFSGEYKGTWCPLRGARRNA